MEMLGTDRSLLRRLSAPVLNFIYPPVCFTCEKLLADPAEKVCQQCWETFRVIEPTHRIWNEIGGKFWEFGVIEAFTSCYLFEDQGPLHEVVHLIKYRGIKSLGNRLGKDIALRINAHAALAQADYLVPVPLHHVKIRERGYNQAEYICNGISEATSKPVLADLLKRTTYTSTQTKLSIHQRRENVAGAFALNPATASRVAGRSFVLIDDVITTGSTMNECAAILRLHGATAVYAASAALAQ